MVLSCHGSLLKATGVAAGFIPISAQIRIIAKIYNCCRGGVYPLPERLLGKAISV